MQVNINAPVLQRNEILIHATPARVWSVLTDINRWVEWNEKISRAHIAVPVATNAGFAWTVNGARIKSVLHTVQNGRAFGWSGTTFGGSAIHNWYLEQHPGGTMVKVEESMEGWLVGLFKNKMNRDLARDMQYWLEALKKESERQA
jgi:hypothetical protein